MISRLIAFFVTRHLLTNLLFLAILVAGVLSWFSIKKEERPDVTYDFVQVTAFYPGATAEEVEHFVTRELEEEIKPIDGVFRITSTVNRGSTVVMIELENGIPNKNEAITEIRNAALGTVLPPDVRDKPYVHVFKSSKKAIIDVALIHKKAHLLTNDQRLEMQRYAAALELQLVNMPQINSVNRHGYLQEELQINVDPAKLLRYQIPLSQVINEVTTNHIRQPAGHIEIKDEPSVTINAQLDNVEKLNKLFIQAGFQGTAIDLKSIATVRTDFSREKQIIKVNGHESIMFNVVKNSSAGILDAITAVKKVTDEFKSHGLQDSDVELILLDDESFEVRNRLRIIAINGSIGFILILLTLFVFLNKRSGIWVAMGIPFTICFTLGVSLMLGYTINNVTLAAVIIVMGIVVDDAIVVAENVGRFRSQGYNSYDAAVQGTSQVFLPVLASIVTTCAAFVPLYFFEGRFGGFVSYIPLIVFLMLFASLLESLIILPGHLHFETPKILQRFSSDKDNQPKKHWFDKLEQLYGNLLIRILPFKFSILLLFVLMFVGAIVLANNSMHFVMFPHSETREIILLGTADKKSDRYDTANISREIENLIIPDIGKEVVGLRTEIARSRHGSVAKENVFRMIIEIVPKEDRNISADELIERWKPATKNIAGLKKLSIQKSRWGQSSGIAIEVLVLENDDALRNNASQLLLDALKKHPQLVNADIDKPLTLPEYKIDINRDKIKRLSISAKDIATTFRASLEGNVLYELPKGHEHIDVRLSVVDDAKRDIESILKIPVENRSNYLAPLADLVTIKQVTSPTYIKRRDSRRISTVFADLKKDATKTPLQIAEDLENGVFRVITRLQPSTTLNFDGEIADTRESRGELRNAVIMVLVLIFIILVVLFNSMSRAILIMLAIPFGAVGVIGAFYLHGQYLFGFFAAIGALGMAGVVINDSIILITKLDSSIDEGAQDNLYEKVARIVQTRLKAVVLTTLTTVAGVMPTAYGLAGYDALLAEMMMALAWGLLFGTLITLVLVPSLYCALRVSSQIFTRSAGKT